MFQRGWAMEPERVLESCWEIPRIVPKLFALDRRVPRPRSRHPSTRLSTPSPARRPAGRPVDASRRTSCVAGRHAPRTVTGAAAAHGGRPPDAPELCMAVDQHDPTEWPLATA